MGLRRRSALLLSATFIAGAALSFDPVVMSNLEFDGGGARLAVGSVRTSMWSAALAQTPSAFVLENVSLVTPFATYRAKRIEFEGVTTARGDVEALLNVNASEPLHSRLAKLSATRITIPELVTEQTQKGMESSSTTYNVVFADIAQGRVRQMSAENGTGTVGAKDERFAMSHGRVSLNDVDTVETARVYTERTSTPQPLKTLYGSFDVENLQLTDGSKVDIRVARMGARDVRGRPTRITYTELAERMAKNGDKKLSPAETRELMGAFGDLFGAWELGLIEATGIQISDRSSGKDGVGRIARIAYTGAVGSRSAETRVEGIDVTSKEGSVRVANISFAGFSFQPTFEAFGSVDLKKIEEMDPETLRKFIPTLGTIRFSGVDLDVPNTDAKPPKAERIRLTMKDFEVTADKQVNGIPTNIRFGVQNLAMSLPQDSKEDGLKDLAALGYKNLDFSFATAATWNEAGKEIVVRDVSVRGQEMGAVSLKGVFGNVSKDVFGADSAIALVALVGATAKSAELSVENTGLFDRFLANEAKKQKKTPEALRREYGVTAAVGIPAILGNSQQAKDLGNAVARFIAKPGRLTVAARAKNGTGLGVADLALLGEPASVLEKLEITATNE